MAQFTKDEHERYARHILLREIGGPGQQRLKAGSAVLIGMGGLGAPAALYLAAAGLGRLRLVDHDVVSLSNLQRQVLFTTEDVGRAKVAAGAARLAALNPHVALETVAEKLTPANAQRLIANADVVLDGTDDFATRFAVNEACHALGVPLVSGAVGRWEGQIGVFASGRTKGLPTGARAPCYRCFVPEAPPETEPCALAGIVGALTGIIGAAMALEAIKVVAQAGDALLGRTLFYEGLRGVSRVVQLPPDEACSVCGGRG